MEEWEGLGWKSGRGWDGRGKGSGMEEWEGLAWMVKQVEI